MTKEDNLDPRVQDGVQDNEDSKLRQQLLDLLESMGEGYFPLHEYPPSYESQNVETRERYADNLILLFKQKQIAELQYVLVHASGGGSWRRVIITRIGDLQNE